MINDLTELVFILDKSGSMHGLEADPIGGFNSLIEKQKKEDGRALVTTILFDDKSEMIHDRVDLQYIRSMTNEQYVTGGTTALLDAVGGAVNHIRKIHKYIRPEDVPAKTLFIITTDGMENASRIYSSNKVKKMIERQKNRYGWEFLFIGANIDSVETAKHFGINSDRSVNYHADGQGTAVVFDAVSKTVCNFRKSRPLSSSWSDEIDKDYESRK